MQSLYCIYRDDFPPSAFAIPFSYFSNRNFISIIFEGNVNDLSMTSVAVNFSATCNLRGKRYYYGTEKE